MKPMDWGRTVGAGMATAMLLVLVMIPASQFGLSPLPKPLAQAFLEQFFGSVPLPVAILFHLAYVTFWGIVYVLLFRERFTFTSALGLGIFLWFLAIMFFFPFVGWGLWGQNIGPQLLTGSLIPNLLFSFFLWGFCQLFFRPGS